VNHRDTEAQRKEKEGSPQVQEVLRLQIREIDRNIKKAKSNLALLDAEFISSVQARIREWDLEMRKLQGDLERINQSPRVAVVEEFILHLKEMVQHLRGQRDDPSLVRNYLAEVIDRVEVFMVQVQKKRVWHYLDHLTIKIKGGGEVVMPVISPPRS